jgi:hypothetical protein
MTLQGLLKAIATIPLAQTFTVGMSGTLTGVDLRLVDSPGRSVHVSIETIGRQDRLPTGDRLRDFVRHVIDV